MPTTAPLDFQQLATAIKRWGKELGFQQVGITDTDLGHYEPRFREWLQQRYHGDMDYMQRHAELRLHPETLVPHTQTIIMVRINYLPANSGVIKTLNNHQKGYISRYALGGDYHKFIRKRLTQLAHKITHAVGDYGYRAFADSAPVLEKALAEKSNLGWIGKNTLLLNREAGSWFFLGALFTDLPLPLDQPEQADQCGKCQACRQVCPTQAIVAPYVLDARRCISYLTIEHKGAIPLALRPLLGNRIYGCDDCQLICPWNRYAKATDEAQFNPRHNLDSPQLITLLQWTESEFLDYTTGSAIRRIGHERWLRNIAVALGNADYHPDIVQALNARLKHPSALVQEHINWALTQQQAKQSSPPTSQPQLLQARKLNQAYE